MKILISPAKSMDFDSTIDSLKCTQPVFLNKTSEINSVLKTEKNITNKIKYLFIKT